MKNKQHPLDRREENNTTCGWGPGVGLINVHSSTTLHVCFEFIKFSISSANTFIY